MNKTPSFLISLIFTLIILSIFYFNDTEKVTEKVVILRAIDGDTIELTDGRIVRLLNINSPEKNYPNANLSYLFLNMYEGKEVELEKEGNDKYNRVLARIYTPEYINLIIIEEGLASKFLVEKKEKDLFYKAEEEAILLEKGIWQKSTYSGCIKISNINPNNELLTLINNCPNKQINNFYIKDESRKTYIFKNSNFTSIKLHSFTGKDNSSDLFWDLNTDVWNNDQDTVYLFDESGNLISHEAYGY